MTNESNRFSPERFGASLPASGPYVGRASVGRPNEEGEPRTPSEGVHASNFARNVAAEVARERASREYAERAQANLRRIRESAARQEKEDAQRCSVLQRELDLNHVGASPREVWGPREDAICQGFLGLMQQNGIQGTALTDARPKGLLGFSRPLKWTIQGFHIGHEPWEKERKGSGWPVYLCSDGLLRVTHWDTVGHLTLIGSGQPCKPVFGKWVPGPAVPNPYYNSDRGGPGLEFRRGPDVFNEISLDKHLTSLAIDLLTSNDQNQGRG